MIRASCARARVVRAETRVDRRRDVSRARARAHGRRVAVGATERADDDAREMRTVDALDAILGASTRDDDDAVDGVVENDAVVAETANEGRAGGRGVETETEAAAAGRAAAAERERSNDDDDATSTEESDEKKMFREFLSLLVAVGGVKGTLAVVIGALASYSAFGDLGGAEGAWPSDGGVDLTTTAAIGLALAAPTVCLDALVMGIDWTSKAEAANSREDDGLGRGFMGDFFEPLSRYQQEETLSNPCKSMPAWMDLSVAFTARVADEMLERGVVLGLSAKWLADRGVEYGFEPYDVEAPAKALACVLVYLVLEARVRRVQKQSRVQAFRVERNPVTGKQKLVPVSEDELRGGAKDGPLAGVKSVFSKKKEPSKNVSESKKSPKPPTKAETQAFENILRGKGVKDFLEGSRSRLFFVSQSLAFVSTGSIFAPIVGGYLADSLYILWQRNAMARFISSALDAEAPPRSEGPPKADVVRKAQKAALAKTLKRKKEKMGRDLVNAMKNDPSISRDINEMFTDVVRKTKSVKDMEEASAIDDVLAYIAKSADVNEPGYADKMRDALVARAKELDSIANDVDADTDTDAELDDAPEQSM